jgi:TonB family protein
VLIAAVIVVATLQVRDDVEVIEVEIVDIPAPALPPPLPPPLPPAREPESPAPVPGAEAVRRVETAARPYHERAEVLNRLPREAAAVSRPAITPAFAIPMEATVDGGGGFEVVAVAGADPGMWGDPDAGGLPAVEYADTWEITAEPEPLNDRDFRPAYPPRERARGAEATVEVELLVDSTGVVAGTRVLTTDADAFSRSALAYCRRLRFRPALANRVPVASRIVWVVDYRFGDR